MPDPRQPAFDSWHFRHVLGHFPTGVAVVTALADGRPAGLTVQSFCSLSLDPPLVLFCVGKSSTSWPEVAAAGTFCVNVLSGDQAALCWQFARSGGDKFAGLSWSLTGGGAPLLAGALAWVDCRIQQTTAAGDHLVVIASVLELDARSDNLPLVYFRGSCGHFQPTETRSA